MTYFAWFWIVAMSFAMVLNTGMVIGILWRESRWGFFGIPLGVSVFVIRGGTGIESNFVSFVSLALACPFIFVVVTHYIRFVRRHRCQRLCAECGYPLLPGERNGRPCPECGNLWWLIVPAESSEMYKKSPDMPRFWIRRRYLAFLFVFTAAILGAGAELARTIGREIDHEWASPTVALGVWMASAAVVIAVLVSVRRTEDAKRIARELAEWEARNGAARSVSGDVSKGSGTPPPPS